MTHEMDEKMEQTIQYLRSSMPRQQPTKISFGTLMKLAWSEIQVGFAVLSLAAVLIFGLLAARLLQEPMLVMLCTMPLPMLLLFHRCILCENTALRELEETFQYSYTEMLAARASVISLLTLAEALGAALAFHGIFGASFLRLTHPLPVSVHTPADHLPESSEPGSDRCADSGDLERSLLSRCVVFL